MTITAMKTGIRPAIMLDEVFILQHTRQVGQEDDLEVDSPEWEMRRSKDAPRWWYLLSIRQSEVIWVVDALDLLVAWMQWME